MRTTLNLDEDVYERLREKAERSGRSVEDVANDSLRQALSPKVERPGRRFEVRAKAMGTPASENGYDDIPKLLDRLEGADRR